MVTLNETKMKVVGEVTLGRAVGRVSVGGQR